MSESDKQEEAKEHADRAARQMKHAAKNVGRAARDEVEHVDEVVENTIAEGLERGKRTVNRIDTRAWAVASKEASIGFLALSASVYAAGISFQRFRSAYEATRGMKS
jgi:hypothetical protein